MQRVTSFLPSWDKTKTSSKKGFDKAYAVVDKLGPPINRLSNKIGAEAFWPTTLDKESDKAARILRSFCKDGFYVEDERPSTIDVPRGKQRVLKSIPEKVIQNAVGLAIFTTMRTGLWLSGASGSGVIIARQENGEWSAPSGIMLHTVGLGFLVGVDIYDCVLVINNRKALASFTAVRATLGGEISAVAGPVGVGGVLENDGKWKEVNRPVFSYLKSRGLYAGVQIDGSVIIERSDENERFYGERIGATDILAGKVRHAPYETRKLLETVKAAEGRSDVDESLVQEVDMQPIPGNAEIITPTATTFGVPEPDDPDPFGVLALEKAGLEIREAGSKSRPASSQFEFNPAPSSPLYHSFHRPSMDTLVNRSSRGSMASLSHRNSVTRTSTDRATQTVADDAQINKTTSPKLSPRGRSIHLEDKEEKAPAVQPPAEVDYTKIDLAALGILTKNNSQDFDGTTISESPAGSLGKDEGRNSLDSISDLESDDEEEPVIFEVASTQATVITPRALKVQGGLVDIPKRGPPPPLPPRSSARNSRHVESGSARSSPLKEGFDEVDLNEDSTHGGLSPTSQRDSFLSSYAVQAPAIPPRRSHLTAADASTQRREALVINEERNEPEDKQKKLLKKEDLTTTNACDSHEAVHKQDAEEQDEFHSLPPTPGAVHVN